MIKEFETFLRNLGLVMATLGAFMLVLNTYLIFQSALLTILFFTYLILYFFLWIGVIQSNQQWIKERKKK
jgi:hypothetical protein